MSVDADAQAAPGKGRKALRFLGRLLRITLIGVVVVAGLLIAFPPNGLVKALLERGASEKTGRTVTIGSAHLRFWPDITLALNDVSIANAAQMPGADLMRAKAITAKAKLEPVFKGQGEIESLVVSEPQFNLQEDAAGVRNWVFTPRKQASGELMLPRSATIEKGRLSYASAKTGMKGSASDIAAAVTGDHKTGSVTAKGQLVAGGEGVNFDVAVADANAVVAGTASPIKASLDARPGKVQIDGTALFAAAAEFSGDLNASSGSLSDLLRWLGAETAPAGEPIKTSLAGKIKATTMDVTFTETDISVNGSTGRLGGRLDLAGPRPKLEGTLDSELLDVARMSGSPRRIGLVPESLTAAPEEQLEVARGWDHLLTDLNALENGPAQLEAAPQPEAVSLSKGWSEQPFNLKAIGVMDLDLIVTAREIVFGNLDLKNGRVKAGITDGLLVADIEGLDVAKGSALGTLNLDSRATPPTATVAIKLTDVAAEPIITELTGKPLLSGISNVEITAKAAGQNQSQLTSTLEGKARFQMARGAVRGFDIRRMISEWWRSWKFDLTQKTNFEKLEARYDIKNGIAKSEPELTLGGSEVEISSKGRVNVPARRLNQEIRIKVVPPPTALPIPVRISGDWAKPDIGLDWGGLFSGVAGLGGPQAIAPAQEPPPPKVQAAIRRVLESNLPSDKLSDGAKVMLQSLLPADAEQ